MRRVHRERDAVNDLLTLLGVTSSAIGQNGRWMILAAVFHYERANDFLVHNLLLTFACNFPDDVAQQYIAGVGIPHLRARLKLQRLVFEARDSGSDRSWQSLQPHVVWKSSKAGNSGGVRQQMMNRDCSPCIRT